MVQHTPRGAGPLDYNVGSSLAIKCSRQECAWECACAGEESYACVLDESILMAARVLHTASFSQSDVNSLRVIRGTRVENVFTVYVCILNTYKIPFDAFINY